jgi:hypothetical protein
LVELVCPALAEDATAGFGAVDCASALAMPTLKANAINAGKMNFLDIIVLLPRPNPGSRQSQCRAPIRRLLELIFTSL